MRQTPGAGLWEGRNQTGLRKTEWQELLQWLHGRKRTTCPLVGLPSPLPSLSAVFVFPRLEFPEAGPIG